MLNIEAIKDFDKFLELKPIWNKLLAESDVDFPFLTFEWLSNWWTKCGNGKKLLVLLIKENSEIIGIAPLMITNTKYRYLPVRSISFMANYHSHKAGFIVLKRKREVVSAILTYLKQYDYGLLYFNFIEEGSITYTGLEEALAESGMRYVKFKNSSSPYLSISDTWENFFKTKSINLRKNIRCMCNSFNRLKQYEVINYSDSDIDYAMKQVFDISRKTWKFADGTALVSNKDGADFYKSLADIASANKWLNIYILRLNNIPIAFQYDLKYKEKAYLLKTGYDEEHGELSPGTFLLVTSMKDSFENRVKEYDFLGEDEPYKMQWASSVRSYYKYYIFNNTIYGKALCLLETRIVNTIRNMGILKRFLFQR